MTTPHATAICQLLSAATLNALNVLDATLSMSGPAGEACDEGDL